jgi:polyisoprenyl-phosphate glycosyltransferase
MTSAVETHAALRQLGLLSVVAPMLDEEKTLTAFYERVASALDGVPFELILVDDGSTDATLSLLTEIAGRDPRVKVVSLSRNFGHQIALTAGLDHAVGDAVVMLDSDLQDPPELIPALLESWRNGADVVYAVRGERIGEGRLILRVKRGFYWLFGRIAKLGMASDSGDFRLIDRRVLETLTSMRERNRFLRGMTIWIGFVQTAVPYTRDPRYDGAAKYSLKKLVRLAFDGLSSFSFVPLQVATWLGFTFSFIAFVSIPTVLVLRIYGTYLPGFASTTIVVLLLSGIQLIALGVIGEYIGRIYDEVRGRPLYVVRRIVDVSTPVADDPRGATEVRQMSNTHD